MKIGGTNYFWSFKAKKDRMTQIQNEKTLKFIEELKPQVAEAEALLSDAKRGREEDEDDDEEVQKQSDKGEGNDKKKYERHGIVCTSTTTATTKKGVGGRAKKLARLSEL